jgi:hypothetical protein
MGTLFGNFVKQINMNENHYFTEPLLADRLVA